MEKAAESEEIARRTMECPACESEMKLSNIAWHDDDTDQCEFTCASCGYRQIMMEKTR